MLNKFYKDKVMITTHNIRENAAFVNSIVSEILEYVHNLDRRFKKQPFYVGSFYTDLKVSRADEFDFCVILDVGSTLDWKHSPYPFYGIQRNKEIARTSTQVRCPPIENKSTQIPEHIQNSNSTRISEGLACHKCHRKMEVVRTLTQQPCPPAGKTFVRIPGQIPNWNNERLNDGLACLTIDEYLISLNVKRWFKALVSEAFVIPRIRQYVNVDRLSDSPATTLMIKHPTTDEKISVDLAPLIEGHIPFSIAFGWPRPGARWPTCTKIQEIKTEGIHLVAKDPEYWSLSFVICEQKLLDGADLGGTCRKKSQRILKKLREMWCSQGSRQEFTSYHLKNILFWECEIHPDDSEWTDEKLSLRVASMCYSIIYHILRGNLPLYFHTRINLLEKKDWNALRKVVQNIFRFLKNPDQFLVPNML